MNSFDRVGSSNMGGPGDGLDGENARDWYEFEVLNNGEDTGETRIRIKAYRQTSVPSFHEFVLDGPTHQACLNLFDTIAADLGTRVPLNRRPHQLPTFHGNFTRLLTENLSPDILYGYGDPAVIRTATKAGETHFYAVVTSNDAPNSMPILSSPDAKTWSLAGFVFPDGKQPAWTAVGRGVADFWAPEMHLVDGYFRVYFAARQISTGSLAIGIASARSPEGPFSSEPVPLLRGDVIDPNVLMTCAGERFLFWKEDSNDRWPTLLTSLLHSNSRLISVLFVTEEDRRTAFLLEAMFGWIHSCGPMERFFLQQVLIEAVSTDFLGFRSRLENCLKVESDLSICSIMGEVLRTVQTRVYGQRMSADGLSLIGEKSTVLQNDLAWEAHLIEGVWTVEERGKYYMFYAGNDFSTTEYGIGVAVADAPLGPYRKMPNQLLRSTAEWSGPGHPSVARGLDGRPWLFFHAFFPGQVGYKQFRALLTLPIIYLEDGVRLADPDNSLIS